MPRFKVGDVVRLDDAAATGWAASTIRENGGNSWIVKYIPVHGDPYTLAHFTTGKQPRHIDHFTKVSECWIGGKDEFLTAARAAVLNHQQEVLKGEVQNET